MVKVALQLWSVKEAMEQNPEDTIRKLSEAGYDGVQLAGDYGKSGAEWKKLLSENHLGAAGIHIPVTALENKDELNHWISFSNEIGNKKLIIPFVDEEWRTLEGYKKLSRLLNEAYPTVSQAGLQLGYHHHDFEFATVETGITGWDVLEEMTEPDQICFEVDVYWTEYAGVHTYNLLDRLKERVFSIHLKDMVEENGHKRTAAIGHGTLDLKSFADRVDTEWLVVEQEHFDGDPLEEVKPSANVVKGWYK
ncbi:sugar phosphate isomerase/epimerase family protein [Jeotgalibacillus terrae]|uniref:Sugar phosphate isomerase/epimerase family protein n=1 Tax=Jeotgalibacillus terrae TaxID=587735 RepID=A0ABW5ZED4_9BACL|nr:sugar phosphate isomerase/epimerase [Jeotgalibacillus terrae]MBM7579153.1 sugar phosphate isomerase/epimerase [Jeotgalibacillus terrae]